MPTMFSISHWKFWILSSNMRKNWNLTLFACFAGTVTQAIICNFAPLLFLTFQRSFGITLAQLSLLVTLNFATQLATDLSATFFVDKIGYRICMVAAHFLTVAGLLGLAFLPSLMGAPFWGLLIPTILYAIGGGLIEVLASPIVEGCPTENKAGAMSLLHSFYCWGHMGVALLSALFFWAFGIENWRILAILWALIPLINGVLFTQVPIATQPPAEKSGGIATLLRKPLFWIFLLLMFSGGAAEQAISQWISAFAESGLKMSKAMGDLLGPCLFAGCMGLPRLLFAGGQEKLLRKILAGGAILCLIAYPIAAFSPIPLLSLAACALIGFGVGLFWPGTCTLAAHALPGSTALFALLALAGDIGCTSGPALLGFVANANGGDLRIGIAVGTIFPLCLIIGLILSKKAKKKLA